MAKGGGGDSGVPSVRLLIRAAGPTEQAAAPQEPAGKQGAGPPGVHQRRHLQQHPVSLAPCHVSRARWLSGRPCVAGTPGKPPACAGGSRGVPSWARPQLCASGPPGARAGLGCRVGAAANQASLLPDSGWEPHPHMWLVGQRAPFLGLAGPACLAAGSRGHAVTTIDGLRSSGLLRVI